MIKILEWIERFWKLPENRQMLSICFVLIAVIFSLYINEKSSHMTDLKRWQLRSDSISYQFSNIERVHGIEMYEQQRRCDSLAYARREADYLELKSQLDAALQTSYTTKKNANKIIQTQEKTIHALKKAAK